MPDDKLVVVTWHQDADSFGWAIHALFHVTINTKDLRWGTLDLVTATDYGEGQPVKLGMVLRTQAEVIRNSWWYVDWHKSEQEAQAALTEALSRHW